MSVEMNREPLHASGTSTQEGALIRTAANKKKIRIIYLCDYNLNSAATSCDFTNSFFKYSKHEIVVAHCPGRDIRRVDINDFDVLVVHYSLTLALDSYIVPSLRDKIKKFKGLKILFIQDEYRFIDRTIEAIIDLNFKIVFSALEASEQAKIYTDSRLASVRFEQVMTGYVPQWLTLYKTIPYGRRLVDVGYRGRTYPAWFGEAGRDRIRIGQRFLKDARRYGLKCNIRWREQDRLYGARWVQFIQQCRAQLCTESAVSVIDRSGEIASRSEVYTDLIYKKTKDHVLTEAEYLEIKGKFVEGREGEVEMSLLSPRALEAVALRTMLVMYEGRYSGVFEPWVHYVPLKKDHSNMAEVVAVIRDKRRASEIIANAYADIAQNPEYGFRRLVSDFDSIVDEELSDDMKSRQYYFDRAHSQSQLPFEYMDNPHAYGAQELSPIGYASSKTKKGIRTVYKRVVRFLGRKDADFEF